VETAPLPLHDVVVADDPRGVVAPDAVQIAACESPGSFRLAGRSSEAAVVVSNRAHQVAVGGVEIAGAGQAEFADQAIVKNVQDLR
jgi:hypothetical protein